MAIGLRDSATIPCILSYKTVIFPFEGLYNVEKYWKAIGMSGYVVYKFALKRCDNQGLPVWQLEDNVRIKQSSKYDALVLLFSTSEMRHISTALVFFLHCISSYQTTHYRKD